MSRRSEGRSRAPFDLNGVVDLAELDPTDLEEEAQLAELLARAPRTVRRKARSCVKRVRRKGRLNYRVGLFDLIAALLCCPSFFAIAEQLALPDSRFGPKRGCNAITVWLWECLVEELDSFYEMEAFFRHPLVWEFVRFTLQTAWPKDSHRRVPELPMSRSQFHRYRRKLEDEHPGAIERAKKAMTALARDQALAMGYFTPGAGSIAHPDLRNVVRSDGTHIKARLDAIEGDKVEDPITGAVEQARYDHDALLGLDDKGDLSPGYRWVVSHVDTPEFEQEGVILDFGRAVEGEPEAAAEQFESIGIDLPAFRHYLYDMAVQGAFVNRMYRHGLHPITKLPRNPRGEPANALIEIRQFEVGDGRSVDVQIYGLDGVTGIKAVADGRELFVELTPIAVRDRPGGRVLGEFEIPHSPVIHPGLRGQRLLVRLDGQTINGRQRPQYIRWINEHTATGRELLPQRNATESQNSLIENMSDSGRARSVGELNNTLDLTGYFFTRNLKAALAFERRTGHSPLSLEPRPRAPSLLVA